MTREGMDREISDRIKEIAYYEKKIEEAKKHGKGDYIIAQYEKAIQINKNYIQGLL